MAALYNYILPQLAMLILTNGLYLIYTLQQRPHLNKLNLIFTILFILLTTVMEGFFVYFKRNDMYLFASQKTNTAYPLVIAICSVMIMMVLWGLWRVVWEISFLVNKFKHTLLYL
jgi:hypothetical protein